MRQSWRIEEIVKEEKDSRDDQKETQRGWGHKRGIHEQ